MATNVKKRVFGSDLPLDVKKKLEARQLMSSGEAAFGQEITSKYREHFDGKFAKYKPEDILNSDTSGHLEMASRTPWARLWTSITIEEESNVLISFIVSCQESKNLFSTIAC